ncbi:hypothetical protein D3C71_2229340 [compost metagenome]
MIDGQLITLNPLMILFQLQRLVAEYRALVFALKQAVAVVLKLQQPCFRVAGFFVVRPSVDHLGQ